MLESNSIEITTLRKEVKEVSLVKYGEADYQYGDMFNLDNYQLLVEYENFPNEIIDLDYSMFIENMEISI